MAAAAIATLISFWIWKPLAQYAQGFEATYMHDLEEPITNCCMTSTPRLPKIPTTG
jgi:hypothetical protein